MSVLADTGVVFAREMRPTLRNPFNLLLTMVQPLIFLLLFGPLLVGTPGTGEASPWQWFVPGILVMIGVFSTVGAGYLLQTELNGGSLERMLVTPLNRVAMLVGRTLKEVSAVLLQAVVIVVAVLPLGFRFHPVSALAGLALLGIFGVGIGSLAFAVAIASRRHPEVFWGVQEVVLFPLVLLSGVLLPLEGAPAWMAALSRINPVTYIVDAERSLFAGDIARPEVGYGAVAALGVAIAGLILGSRAMRRATL